MKLYSLLLLGAVLSTRVEAQAVAPKEPTNVDVWLSAGVGSGAIDGEQRLASSLALWVSGRHVLVGLRSGGIGHFPNDGGSTTNGNDVALLAGLRATSSTDPGRGLRRGVTASIAVGPSSLGREVHVGNDVRHLSRQAALGYSADATLYLRLVGIGLSVFGAASPDHGYNAVSLNISLGKIH